MTVPTNDQLAEVLLRVVDYLADFDESARLLNIRGLLTAPAEPLSPGVEKAIREGGHVAGLARQIQEDQDRAFLSPVYDFEGEQWEPDPGAADRGPMSGEVFAYRRGEALIGVFHSIGGQARGDSGWVRTVLRRVTKPPEPTVDGELSAERLAEIRGHIDERESGFEVREWNVPDDMVADLLAAYDARGRELAEERERRQHTEDQLEVSRIDGRILYSQADEARAESVMLNDRAAVAEHRLDEARAELAEWTTGVKWSDGARAVQAELERVRAECGRLAEARWWVDVDSEQELLRCLRAIAEGREPLSRQKEGGQS